MPFAEHHIADESAEEKSHKDSPEGKSYEHTQKAFQVLVETFNQPNPLAYLESARQEQREAFLRALLQFQFHKVHVGKPEEVHFKYINNIEMLEKLSGKMRRYQTTFSSHHRYGRSQCRPFPKCQAALTREIAARRYDSPAAGM